MKKIIYLITFFYSVFLGAQAPNDTQSIDFTKLSTELEFDTLNTTVSGIVKAEFIAKENNTKAYLDAQKFEYVTALDSTKITYTNNKIWLEGNFKKGDTYTCNFKYKTQPKKALYFWGWNEKNIDSLVVNHKQIWSQGQGKYTSYWLPSIDNMNDKIVFDLKINFDREYQVISNGNLIKTQKTSNNKTQWHYQMQQPMSSYLVALAIGKYEKKTAKSLTGIPLENYIYKERINDYEATYKHHKKIFDFLELEIGIPYPWKTYRQVPVREFLYAGMENTSCTLFDDDFIIDQNSFNDKNFVSVSAHELAHQWFGNLITETNSNHHWLHEGFATYFALKVEKEIFGEEHFYYKLYESAEQLTATSEKRKSTPLVTPKGSSLNYYQRGAWTLFALEKYIGTTNFKKSIRLFLNQYAYKNVTTDDFLLIVAQVSKKDLSTFSTNWIYNKDFPTKKALAILTESDFMKKYLRLAGERTQPLAGKYQYLNEALLFPVSPYLAQEVVSQLYDDTSPTAEKLILKAFKTNHPKVQFALANLLTTIPRNLKTPMEKLLKSSSNATVESALYNLWNNFDADKMKYLEATKTKVGFNNKNIRTLWLLLALNTKGFSVKQRASFFKELQSYTATNHTIGTKINAFKFLEILQSFNDQSIINLGIGATHPNWQFNKFCSKTIERLLKQPKFQQKFVRLNNQLPIKIQKMVADYK